MTKAFVIVNENFRQFPQSPEGQPLLITSIYLPNGNPQPGPKFDYKLAWFGRLIEHAAEHARGKNRDRQNRRNHRPCVRVRAGANEEWFHAQKLGRIPIKMGCGSTCFSGKPEPSEADMAVYGRRHPRKDAQPEVVLNPRSLARG